MARSFCTQVTESFTVDEDDPDGVKVMLPSPLDIVTIITCDGTRYYTGDPVFGHDYTERRVMRAARTYPASSQVNACYRFDTPPRTAILHRQPSPR